MLFTALRILAPVLGGLRDLGTPCGVGVIGSRAVTPRSKGISTTPERRGVTLFACRLTLKGSDKGERVLSLYSYAPPFTPSGLRDYF
jgi:hypothetical protein